MGKRCKVIFAIMLKSKKSRWCKTRWNKFIINCSIYIIKDLKEKIQSTKELENKYMRIFQEMNVNNLTKMVS